MRILKRETLTTDLTKSSTDLIQNGEIFSCIAFAQTINIFLSSKITAFKFKLNLFKESTKFIVSL